MKEPQENQEIDQLFRARLENYSSNPEASSRDAIFSQLEEQNKKRKKVLLQWIAAAASIIVIIGSVFYLFRSGETKKYTALETTTAQKNSHANHASADSARRDRQKELVSQGNKTLASATAINTPASVESRNPLKSKIEKSVISRAQKKEVVLPDNSLITLDPYSSISYAENFTKERKIQLNGNAYFSVQKKSGKNFKVCAGPTTIEVLGTIFYVQASENLIRNIQVTEGVVAFYRTDRADSRIELHKGESAFLNKENMPVKSVVPDKQKSMQKEELVFKNTSLNIVIAKLNAYFSEHIEAAEPEILNCAYSGSFRSPESIDEVLKVLTGTLDLTYTRRDTKIILSGKGCR